MVRLLTARPASRTIEEHVPSSLRPRSPARACWRARGRRRSGHSSPASHARSDDDSAARSAARALAVAPTRAAAVRAAPGPGPSPAVRSADRGAPDLLDRPPVEDRGEQLPRAAAVWAGQHLDLEHPAHQLGPRMPCSRPAMLARRCGTNGCLGSAFAVRSSSRAAQVPSAATPRGGTGWCRQPSGSSASGSGGGGTTRWRWPAAGANTPW